MNNYSVKREHVKKSSIQPSVNLFPSITGRGDSVTRNKRGMLLSNTSNKYNKNLYNSEKKNRGTSVMNGKVSAIKRLHVPSTMNTLNFKREGL